MKRSLLILLLIFTLLFAFSCGDDDDDDDSSGTEPDDDDATDDDAVDDDSAEPYYPGSTGPYAVGNTTRIFVDHDRWDIWLKDNRHLLTEIWYPVLPEDATGEYTTMADMLGKYFDFIARVVGIFATDEEIANFHKPLGSITDAPLAPDGPFPIVIYSHGNGGIRFQSYALCEHLASHGYIVVGVDHPGNAFVTALPQKLIIYNPIRMPFDFITRQGDLMFIMDMMHWLNNDDPQGIFTGAIDVANAGLTGHSYGGNTILEVYRRDKRFSAAVPFAGPDVPILEDHMKGIFYWVALEDQTLGYTNPLNKLMFEWSPAPKALIQMYKAGHYTFTNACDMIPSLMGGGDGCGEGNSNWTGQPITFIDNDLAWEIILSYTTAWFDYRLKKLDVREWLWEKRWPEHLEYHRAFEEGD